MRVIETLSSLFLSFLLIAAPLSAVVYPFFGLYGLAAVACVSGGGVLIFLIRVEANLEKEYRAAKSSTIGLDQNATEKRGPQVRIIIDPVPRLIVTRALGGKGLILVSQGALTHLSKSALQDLMSQAASRVLTPFLPVAGAAWILKTRFRRRMSASAPKSVVQLLQDLFIFPYYQFFSKVSRRCEVV